MPQDGIQRLLNVLVHSEFSPQGEGAFLIVEQRLGDGPLYHVAPAPTSDTQIMVEWRPGFKLQAVGGGVLETEAYGQRFRVMPHTTYDTLPRGRSREISGEEWRGLRKADDATTPHVT